MRILFLAKHDSGDNDDEGAIAFALEQLGHEVVRVQERRRQRTQALEHVDADLCLFLKHPVVSEIEFLSRKMPCAFWYFDMVRPIDGDPTLQARSESRVQWMRDVLPWVRVGFCTDGDWVADDKTGKLVWLMQGADERVAGFGTPLQPNPYPPILFMGMVNHGMKRREHVEHLQRRWGEQFLIMGDGGPRYRKHGRELADVLASVKVVVAPDGPSTDRYWSNRVYLTTSLGGCLLHPWCEGLGRQYNETEQSNLLFYFNRENCDDLIQMFLNSPADVELLRRRGFETTMARHTYRHRCEELLRVIKERT